MTRSISSPESTPPSTGPNGKHRLSRVARLRNAKHDRLSGRSNSSTRSTPRPAALSWGLCLALLIGLIAIPQPSHAARGTFWDDDGSTHEANIEAISAAGITKGCGNGKFCPNDLVTRGELAAFLHRSLRGKIPTGSHKAFSDISSSMFADDIIWLSATGITKGCENGRFCPNDPVSREQIAAFLRRALESSIPTGKPTQFSDVSSSTFASDIAWLSATGITRGCGSEKFCPSEPVTREQLATFLTRALGLDPIQPSVAEIADLKRSGPVMISGQTNVVYDGYHFSGSGRCMDIRNSTNVTIRNSLFEDCEAGIYASSSTNVVIEDNLFRNSGRNFVQFERVTRGRITGNTGSNVLGGSNAEDFISMYMSNGTPSDPILIANNRLSNGGPSRSGSGIALGDNGGSWQIARNNTLINTGQIGIGVAGGSNMTVENNRIYSDQLEWSNVGIVAWVWGGAKHPSDCKAVDIRNNQVDWTNSAGVQNPFWENGSCSNLTVIDNSWQ